MKAAPLPTTAELFARLLPHWHGADAATRRAGAGWYSAAASEADRLAELAPAGIGRVRTAGIIAALSPRAHWSVNLRWAEAIVVSAGSGWPIAPAVSTRAVRAKAWKIAHGADPARVLGGPKVRAFWQAICGDPDAAVVDVWAARAAGVSASELYRAGAYDAVAEAYRALAAIVGVPTRDLQATIWLALRGDKPADPATFSVR